MATESRRDASRQKVVLPSSSPAVSSTEADAINPAVHLVNAVLVSIAVQDGKVVVEEFASEVNGR